MPDAAPFKYCLNTSTIKGTLEEKIALASAAGYQGIEPWARELDEYLSRGGTLKELRSRFEDAGLEVVSLIAFFEWAVEDESRRKLGFEEAKRVMDSAWQIGCGHVAAPPSGLVDSPGLHLHHAAQRYRALIDLGSEYGVIPILEFWGVSKSLGHLSEAVAVAIESGHPAACVLIDIFHMYKRGSPFEGLRIVNGEAVGLVHINDYPADPPRDMIRDAQRVFPGDGVAPLTDILYDLYETGYRGMLSLELFNEEYYQLDQGQAAQAGLQKMQDVVQRTVSRIES
jgi:sugar phosphate isomerase/epimerase